MKKIQIVDIENGKILAKEVSNSKGLMLLSEGTVLKKNT